MLPSGLFGYQIWPQTDQKSERTLKNRIALAGGERGTLLVDLATREEWTKLGGGKHDRPKYNRLGRNISARDQKGEEGEEEWKAVITEMERVSLTPDLAFV